VDVAAVCGGHDVLPWSLHYAARRVEDDAKEKSRAASVGMTEKSVG